MSRTAGERTRKRLADAGTLDADYEIVVDEETLYIPVTSRADVPDRYTVVERELPDRRGQRTPADLLDWKPTYERLGDIVVLDEDDPERAHEAAEAVLDSDLPVETVVNRASKVRGKRRVREFDLLAGEGTETVHREYGYEYLLDIAEVYFSPRLATERRRVTEGVAADELVVDMFAGVGPYAAPMADRGADIVAVDHNPVAVDYLRRNVDRNDVEDRVTSIEGDVRSVTTEFADSADRLVMNLPHSADEFLDTAVALAGEDCLVHYYDIQHEDDPFGPGTRAATAALDGTPYTVERVDERVVRSYAPHEQNVRLDLRLTR